MMDPGDVTDDDPGDVTDDDPIENAGIADPGDSLAERVRQNREKNAIRRESIRLERDERRRIKALDKMSRKTQEEVRVVIVRGVLLCLFPGLAAIVFALPFLVCHDSLKHEQLQVQHIIYTRVFVMSKSRILTEADVKILPEATRYNDGLLPDIILLILCDCVGESF